MCVELWGPDCGWMNFGEWTGRERWHCCWEKEWKAYVTGGCGRLHIYWLGRWWHEGSDCCMGRCWILVLSLVTSLRP